MSVTPRIARDHRPHPRALASRSREPYLDRLDEAARQAAPTAPRSPAATSPTALPSAARPTRPRSAATRCRTSASSPPTTTCCRRISPSRPIPALIKQAAREAGGIAQVAGGVPAMCDGVTQGQPGMELSLFSRDVIAMAAAIGLVAQHVRRRRLSRRLRQDRAGPGDRGARPSAICRRCSSRPGR